ncbi:MAG TPA: GMC family oxidoreductase N-terminal domain-containing protein [Candidatus Acidoferrum sp.]|nr:GMC family oxidoreductase N-terminal domain-containing protein [Candidatus Acidoferrum sp.]
MRFNARQLQALTSICETFFPAEDGWPSAAELGIPEAIAASLSFNPRQKDRQDFLHLLNLWDSRLHSLFSVGKLASFSSLPPELRVRALLSWADSGLRKRRAAFQALRKAVGFLYVMLPELAGQRTPVWDRIGYPGPLGVQTPETRQALKVMIPDGDMNLACDVCVIGSGAGGGVAAAVLAAAGKDVIVLESGGYYDDADFDGAELSSFRRLYAEAGFAATENHSVGLLAGKCLGGGTVVNYCTSFRTPDEIREEWASEVPWIAGDEYTRSMDAVCARLRVNRDHNRISAREQILERGLKSLGWHVDAMPRNVTGCDQGRICGYCGYGCAIGAKQSVTKTWLADAQAHGARLFVDTQAEEILINAGTAVGVEARSSSGHSIKVTCKAVVVACGAIHTPALLLRSGLRNVHIGRHLHLHPVSNVCGIFDEEIRPWEGTLQAIYSDQHRRMTGNFGVKYETTSLQPVIASAVLPWRDPRQYRFLLSSLPHTAAVGVLLRDRHGGRVTTDDAGHAVASYSLSPFDSAHLRLGFLGAAKILEAAGARRIFSPHARFCSYEPGHSGSLTTFTQSMDAAGWESGRLALFSFHIMGTARLGGSRKTSATTPDGETWEVRNLYVMDGASFPSSSGVNPMISIEAIAHRNALCLAEKSL